MKWLIIRMSPFARALHHLQCFGPKIPLINGLMFGFKMTAKSGYNAITRLIGLPVLICPAETACHGALGSCESIGSLSSGGVGEPFDSIGQNHIHTLAPASDFPDNLV